MRVFVLGVLSALSMSIPAAHAQQVASLIINGKPATVQGVALGDGPESCKGTIKPVEFGRTIGREFLPSMIVQSCRTGTAEDELTITYDSTGTKVVAVVRSLYLNTRKVDGVEFFASVERFYGPADFSNHRYSVVAYGSFDASNGRDAELLDYGTGLVVSGRLCGMSVDCPSAFENHTLVTFTLSDQDAYATAEAEGKQAVANSKSDKANAISF